LTATPPPALDFSRPGTPASTEFDDIYFSVEGGLDESRAVFLNGCGLPEAWEGQSRFVIAETGFGTGLNFLATWQMWQERQTASGAHLHFVSIEKYPLDHDSLARALSAFPELSALSEALLERWPGRVRGVHRLEFDGVSLDLWHMDVADALPDMRMQANAWFLDGFSPAKNPDMWSAETLSYLSNLSAPGARLSSFTVAGHVRRSLQDAGFEVERVEGFARKRHRLEAHFPGEASEPSECRPIIVGGGIAGASVARAFLREGITPIVIRSPHHNKEAASANPLALVKPRLDKQDRPESRFFLQAWLYALQHYTAVQTGIVHYAKTEEEEDRFWALDENGALPRRHMYAADAALYFPTAPLIEPVATCKAMLSGSDLREGDVTAWARTDEGWQVTCSDGERIEGSHLVLASGLHLKNELSDLKLRASRGQLSLGDADIGGAMSYGGYAVPCEDRVIFGATHDRLGEQDPYRLETNDDERNAALFTEHIGIDIHNLESLRASVRVNSTETLPILDEIEPRLWILTALGSRGFSHAPLLGAALASRIDPSSPGPLTETQFSKLSRGRGGAPT
jgi:tRNA 5-methylaminomethyl-2-thiouridine biosynthesis bifunctional protein